MTSNKGVAKFGSINPPLAPLIVAQYVGATKDFKWIAQKDDRPIEVQLIPSGVGLKGSNTVARFFARTLPEVQLYGSDAVTASQIDMWIDNAPAPKAEVQVVAESINKHLKLRTFLVGHDISIADIIIYAALRANEKWATVTLSEKSLPFLWRWVSYLESLTQFKEVLSVYAPSSSSSSSSSSTKAEKEAPQKGRAGWIGSYDIGLIGAAEGKVVTRFPPEPSGFLHVGHIKAAMLNNFYATNYKGKLLLRFDDTNPAKEKDDYVDNIKEDLATMDIKPDTISYTSDWFDKLMEYAEKFLKEGKAYIDTTPQLEIQAQRRAGPGGNEGVENKCRSHTVEENLKLFAEMKAGSQLGQQCVMRAKIDMKAKNAVLRDPSLFRCSNEAHYRTGTKYKAYPLYDFACPIVDALEGVTHALRSSEYHDRNALYDWVLKAADLRHVQIEDFSRLNFEYVLLSKRKLQWFVDNKHVEGWHDPRFPTVQGILRRGMTVEALREFILAQGASKALNLMTMDKLWALNKKIIDPVVPRYVAISQQVPFYLTNGPATPEQKSVPRHKKNLALGNKVIFLSNVLFIERDDAQTLKENEEVTLMDWGNAIFRKITRDDKGNVTELAGELHLEGDFKTTEKKLTWLADTEHLVPVVLRTYDFLITKDKLAEGEDFKDFLNPNSLIDVVGVKGDGSLRYLNVGDKIQLERNGYYICDSIATLNKPMVLIAIPDGRPTRVESKNPDSGSAPAASDKKKAVAKK